MKPEDFTKEAMRRAREQEYNNQPQVVFDAPNEDVNDRPYSVYLKESQWNIVLKLLGNERRKSQNIIERTHKYPSDTISSDSTREKHRKHINKLEVIESAIIEEAN